MIRSTFTQPTDSWQVQGIERPCAFHICPIANMEGNPASMLF